jgi:hypothetical protein
VFALRPSALLLAAIAGGVMLQPPCAHAQWWSHAPADFEECADAAEKAATKEEKTFQLSECQSKFAGRRKPGGGYTYFDFMQNRNFDIAGPNPTPEEQKKIDEEYTAFLDNERRSTIAAAFTAKQQQQQQLQQTSLKQGAPGQSAPGQGAPGQNSQGLGASTNEKIPVPVEAPNKPQAVASDLRAHMKSGNCVKHSFSCEWPRLSEGFRDLKKLFSSSPSKAKKS